MRIGLQGIVIGLILCLNVIYAGETPTLSSYQLNSRQLIVLIESTVLKFDEAVKAGDFSMFHSICSKAFREKITTGDLLKVFKPFIDRKIDFSSIRHSFPFFTEVPRLDDYGDLIVNGFYILDGQKQNIAEFHFEYRFEDGRWKPILVRMVSSIRNGVPSALVALKLIEETVIGFNEAVAAGDFNEFYRNCASTLKQNMSAEDLRELFGEFIENKVNLSSALNYNPMLTTVPEIDKNGNLKLTGVYEWDVSESRIYFEMLFRMEASDWKLYYLKISIDD